MEERLNEKISMLSDKNKGNKIIIQNAENEFS